jgi:hypothetical protein
MRRILIGVLIVAVFFGGTLWAIDWFLGDGTSGKRPALAETPPLKPVSRMSTIIAPVAVANNAIRDMLEAQAPRNLTGKRDNPLTELLGKADIGWDIKRGPLAVTGRSDGLAVATTVNGQLRATGQIGEQAGQLTSQLGSMIGGSLGRQVGQLAGKPFDQRLDINGNVTVMAKPALQPNWRIDPNLSANVALADRALNISGIRINVMQEIKPLLDRTVNEQMQRLAAQLRNDPTLEQTARREWAKMCRSIPLGAASPTMPALWLEVKPTRAVAAQPRLDPNWVILTLGVHAETRIVSSETKPNCPFPAQLQIVPPMDQGKVAIAVPIDLPFTELNRLLEAQLKGKTFPEDAKAPVRATVQKATLAASGDRLLISLKVKAQEAKSWFGLGADADVFVWGKPVLDNKEQILRFTDMTLDVESESAFGLAGTVARAAIPYIQGTLAEKAVFDLKPIAAGARKSIEAAILDFQKQTDGVKAETAVTGLRLVGIEFDANTLRVIAEVDGTARALVTKLQ